MGAIGVRVSNRGNLGLMTKPDGLFLSVFLNGSDGGGNAAWLISDTFSAASDFARTAAPGPAVLATGALDLPGACKYPTYAVLTLSLSIHGSRLEAAIGHGGDSLLAKTLVLNESSTAKSGWVALGSSWDELEFDRFRVEQVLGGELSRCLRKPATGAMATILACGASEALDGMRWDLVPGPSGTAMTLRADPTLCLEASSASSSAAVVGETPTPPANANVTLRLVLARCDRARRAQHFVYDQENRTVQAANGQCLVLPTTTLGAADPYPLPDPTSFTAVAFSSDCQHLTKDPKNSNSELGNIFTYSPSLGFLRSVYEAEHWAANNLCVGVCG